MKQPSINSAGSVRVHLMGGEGTGWALDQDLSTTHAALASLPRLVTFAPLRDADVVHTVWEEPLLRIDPWRLDGRRIICHVCNDVFRTFENPFMWRAIAAIGMWIPISRQSCAQIEALGLRATYIPYAVDTSVFSMSMTPERRVAARKGLGIPDDAYVIGNFMRDSTGSDLSHPKPQKAPELLVEILRRLRDRGHRVHALLAGPRRHWIRATLRESGLPFTFVGEEATGDDKDINILPPPRVADLYQISDLHLVTSRWEGGPRAVIEAAATGSKILSTPVGMAPDVLEKESLYDSADEAVARIEDDIRTNRLGRTREAQHERVHREFTSAANAGRFRTLYETIREVPVFSAVDGMPPEQPIRGPRYWATELRTRAERCLDRVAAVARPRRKGLRLCMWHEFHKPPYGGGNQFMMALRKALLDKGVDVVENRATDADVHLCNSAWFDVRKFESLRHAGPLRIIQRVDGPIAVYRGSDWEEDRRIYDLNERFVSATVYQSAWCFRRMRELGFRGRNPVIIKNAVNPDIFHSRGRIPYSPGRKLRLISTAWSDNPRKGGPFYKRLEEALDWDRFEYTFVGRTKQELTKARHIPPVPSGELADILRQHDVYVMASECESCSNALIEALSCGLPAVYLNDGGNAELTGFGGLPFANLEGCLHAIGRIASDYTMFQRGVWVQSIDEIADRYVGLCWQVLGDGGGNP